MDDWRSWYPRQYTQEEADREKDAYLFVWFRKGRWMFFGVHRQDGDKVDVHPPYKRDSLRGLMQWWFQDAVAARRCFVTGLMLPNVCMVNRKHRWI